MKTKIANLSLQNDNLVETEVDFVDFNEINSYDPIAFYFGQQDCSLGKKLPNKNSEEYKELANEYIRGHKTFKKT